MYFLRSLLLKSVFPYTCACGPRLRPAAVVFIAENISTAETRHGRRSTFKRFDGSRTRRVTSRTNTFFFRKQHLVFTYYTRFSNVSRGYVGRARVHGVRPFETNAAAWIAQRSRTAVHSSLRIFFPRRSLSVVFRTVFAAAFSAICTRFVAPRVHAQTSHGRASRPFHRTTRIVVGCRRDLTRSRSNGRRTKTGVERVEGKAVERNSPLFHSRFSSYSPSHFPRVISFRGRIRPDYDAGHVRCHRRRRSLVKTLRERFGGGAGCFSAGPELVVM